MQCIMPFLLSTADVYSSTSQNDCQLQGMREYANLDLVITRVQLNPRFGNDPRGEHHLCLSRLV